MCLKERNGWVYTNKCSLSRKKPSHFEEQSINSQTLLLSWHENILTGCVQVSVQFPLKFTLQSCQAKKWINLTVFTKLFVDRCWKNSWYSLVLYNWVPKRKNAVAEIPKTNTLHFFFRKSIHLHGKILNDFLKNISLLLGVFPMILHNSIAQWEYAASLLSLVPLGRQFPAPWKRFYSEGSSKWPSNMFCWQVDYLCAAVSVYEIYYVISCGLCTVIL